MFSMGIWKDGGFNAKMILIKCKSCDRTVTYNLASEEEFNSFIAPFVIHSLFQPVGFLQIIYINKHYKFEIDLEDTQQKDKVPWNNTTICTQQNGKRFEYYFKTVQKDSYNLMCYLYEFGKQHVPITSGASNGGERPIPSMSSKKSL